jgi:hypothetical protein
MLVTLILVILRPFPYWINNLWISEDSEIYGIPVKTATLHDSDFVKRIQPIQKLTNSPFGHSGTKITWPVKNTFLVQKLTYSPFLSQKDKG